MGLIVNDEITLNNGMKITGAYVTLGRQRMRLNPGPTQLYDSVIQPKYVAQGDYVVWISKDASKDGNTKPLQNGILDFPTTDDDLNTPLHQIMYNFIKKNIYKNTTDC
jgi:hypothetical protein